MKCDYNSFTIKVGKPPYNSLEKKEGNTFYLNVAVPIKVIKYDVVVTCFRTLNIATILSQGVSRGYGKRYKYCLFKKDQHMSALCSPYRPEPFAFGQFLSGPLALSET